MLIPATSKTAIPSDAQDGRIAFRRQEAEVLTAAS